MTVFKSCGEKLGKEQSIHNYLRKMSAPTALKSDKGQGNDRGPLDGSSSEFSEDDTPLAARLNLQGTYQLNDTRKQLPRPILPKKPGFVIPRKKKQANGIHELVLRFYISMHER